MNKFFTALTQRGVLSIEGPDSDTFLQGQTTCDLGELAPEYSIAGAYCTPQGRMVCDFRLVSVADEQRLLSMHAGICDGSAAVFGKYIVFSKAEIANASDGWAHYALWGEGASALFEQGPQGRNSCWQAQGAHWVQVDSEGQRLEAYVPSAGAEALEQWLSGHASAGDEADWQLQEINAGIGHLEPETVEEFIPQMLNYQLTDRVSFSKGCYTGQEVVARMHYRGKLKRPMYLASVSCAEPPAAGTALFQADREQSVGNVVNTAADGEQFKMLAVVTSDAIEAGIHLGSTTGPLLSFHDLPYSLDDDQG